MDGWGGALAAALRSALNTRSVGAVMLRARPVGAGLEKPGQFEVRATGATLEDEGEGEFSASFDSTIIVLRELALVTVCVAGSETDADRVSLVPIAVTCREAALDGGWQDPSFDWQEPAYPERSEGGVNVVAGFVVSARSQARLA